jgi:hypothetical protein
MTFGEKIIIGLAVLQIIIVLFCYFRRQEKLGRESESIEKTKKAEKGPEKESLRISRNERSEVGKIEEGK